MEIGDDHDGTACLGGRFLPAPQVAAAWARICALARAMQAAGAAGGADLLRAQVFTGLLLGTLPLIPPATDDPTGPPATDPPPGRPPVDQGPAGAGPGGSAGATPGQPSAAISQPLRRTPAEEREHADEVGNPAGNEGRDVHATRCDGPPRGATACEDAHRGPPEPDSAAGPGNLSIGGSPPWPPIPLPGHIPSPGCAPDWPPGFPVPTTGPGSARDRAGLDRPAGTDTAGGPGRDGKLHLSVPWRTLAGLASEPGTLSRIGPVTAAVARSVAAVAVAEPGCQWRVVIVGRAGRALAVGGVPRTWTTRAPGTRAAAVQDRKWPDGLVARMTLTIPLDLVSVDNGSAEPDFDIQTCPRMLRPVLAAALSAGSRVARRVTATAAVTGGCSHHDEAPGYRVPGSIRALIEARDQTCRFPCCGQPAWRCDQDHTHAYHRGGRTCACNLAAACRHHHRLKQRPGWQLTQPSPGELIWHTPAGLTYRVTPQPQPS